MKIVLISLQIQNVKVFFIKTYLYIYFIINISFVEITCGSHCKLCENSNKCVECVSDEYYIDDSDPS